MATVSVNLHELVRKMGADPEFLRHTLEWLWQPLMEAAVTDRVGTERYDRTTHRNRHRPRGWGYPVRDPASGHPPAASGERFPALSGTAQAE